MENSLILIYMTCGTEAEAKNIVSTLLERQLIACANIIAPHTALYRWEGAVQSGQEHAVIMKTRAALFGQVKEAACALHSYECPCIVALPLIAGHGPFLEWIETETQPA